VDVIFNMVYLSMGLGFGSPEGSLNFFLNAAMLAAATGIVASAHYMTEQLERASFMDLRKAKGDLVEERVLRVQKEFELDEASGRHARKQNSEHRSTSDRDSASSTHLSSTIANGAPQELSARLAALELMSSIEGWHIPRSDIKIHWSGLLGSGCFGSVFRAEFQFAAVAVKTAAVFVQGDLHCVKHDSVNALLNEIRILRHIRHPNIITFYGACVEKSKQVILVEELGTGRSLKTMVEQSLINSSEQEAGFWHILLGICAGLAHLHKQEPQIAHGDLKPANVMVNLDWSPKLIDLGLSRILSRRRRFGGSKGWAAPEIFERHADTSCSADIFSFGCISFFVATSTRPFKNTNGMIDVTLPWPGQLSGFQVQCQRLCNISVVLKPEERSTSCELLEILAETVSRETQKPLLLQL